MPSAGVAGGARRVCLVASGRGPTDRDVDRVCESIEAFKSQHPDVEVCACLGLLSAGQADRLAAAGTTAYNHNLNTSGGHYADICSTHEYADRVSTVTAAKEAGLSPCSGLIAGMGETDEDLVDVAFALRALSPDSVPVNFLIPFEGTPLAGKWELTPQRCLRILAMVRFVNPDAEVRLAGGREIHLRSLQPLALHVVNSIFLGDYLTSEGQPGAADLAMIADAGFEVEGASSPADPPHRPPPTQTWSTSATAAPAQPSPPTPNRPHPRCHLAAPEHPSRSFTVGKHHPSRTTLPRPLARQTPPAHPSPPPGHFVPRALTRTSAAATRPIVPSPHKHHHPPRAHPPHSHFVPQAPPASPVHFVHGVTTFGRPPDPLILVTACTKCRAGAQSQVSSNWCGPRTRRGCGRSRARESRTVRSR